MATSGNITKTTTFGNVKLAWSEQSQNVANNTTTLNYTLSIYRTSAISSSASKSYSIVFNGVTVASGTTTIGGSGTKVIKSGTTKIPHNSDGTKTFSYSFSQQIDITWSGSWIGTVTGSGTGTLDTIPRATTPQISPTSVAMGSSLSITLPRASSAFTHNLTYTFGSLTGNIATGAATSASWAVPITLANAIPSATSGKGTITCKTYSGSTLIGTTSVSFTATVPASVVPSVPVVTTSEAVTGIAAKFSAFVQNKSKIAVSIAASGIYGSTITGYKTYIQSVEYNGSSFTSNIITTSGTIGIVTIVTDSRGRTAQYSGNLTILPYTVPTITTFSAYRANANGQEDYEGSRLKIELNFSISPVNNLNDKRWEIVYRVKGTTNWSVLNSGTDVYSQNTSFVSGSVFNVDNAYDLGLNITDFFTTASMTLDIPTAFTILDFRGTGKGMAIGKVSEKDALEIAIPVDMTGDFLQEDKKTPTLLNSWVNYGSSYESASYWKDKCGVVHLAGMIKGGAITAETVIFTLPVGYRPRTHEKFFAVSVNAICVIDVYSTGNVAIKTGANSGWLSLSGITFKSA